MSVLLRDLDDGVCTLRLNRPEALNALSGEMATRLREALAEAEADDAVRCVVLTGAGRGFCAGADLGHIAAEFGSAAQAGGAPSSAVVLEAIRRHSVPLVDALLGFSKPLVAAVNGPCAGAGMGLALGADVIVAAESATFTVVFTRRGLVPDYGVTHLLPRLVGLRLARQLCLLADAVPAGEALRMGLVSEVVADAELDAAAGRWARRFAEGPGVALRLTKRLLAESFELDARQAVEREFAAQALAMTTADAIEGVAAFLDKRAPRFTGR
ncbi:MAG TPA: enoyl-CoA hydratase-related protein [Egibacteraceae bacterium]|nr:enoyl-CoA hydratase-related protein [Egibacteraceae bacterium]